MFGNSKILIISPSFFKGLLTKLLCLPFFKSITVVEGADDALLFYSNSSFDVVVSFLSFMDLNRKQSEMDSLLGGNTQLVVCDKWEVQLEENVKRKGWYYLHIEGFVGWIRLGELIHMLRRIKLRIV